MKKLLFLVIGAIFLVVSAIIAFTGGKGEVYFGLPLCLGLLCVGIAVVTANKQHQTVASPSEAKKYPSRNLFGDQVYAEENPETDRSQSQMLWAFFFLLAVAIILWVLGMFFYFKETAFLTVVTVVALIVRSCSKSTLQEAGVKLEQEH